MLQRRIQERVIDRIERIEEARIRSHVESFCKIGPRCDDFPSSIRSTLAYLKQALGEYGYDVEEERCESEYQTNVIAELPGTISKNSVFEIGAHYDTKPNTPGADDNASGLAALLEIARVVAGVRLRRTLRFCFFGLEETTRGGSRTHVARIVSRRNERLAGVLVFEMIGYRTYDANSQRTPFRIPLILWPPRTGDFITVVSDFRSSSIATRFQKAAEKYVPRLRVYLVKRIGMLLKDGIRSDHSMYWLAWRKGVMITDTANFRNPNYHLPSDTPDTLDFKFIAQVARTSAATALEWADISE
jgi:Zn-dependent M28 family amino/carboxypeptidase